MRKIEYILCTANTLCQLAHIFTANTAAYPTHGTCILHICYTSHVPAPHSAAAQGMEFKARSWCPLHHAEAQPLCSGALHPLLSQLANKGLARLSLTQSCSSEIDQETVPRAPRLAFIGAERSALVSQEPFSFIRSRQRNWGISVN